MQLPVGQMVLFARVVESGSFAAAAKSLGQTRAAVSKQIASLEERIGAQLLQRTTRSMHLTEIGKEFYARCARIAQEGIVRPDDDAGRMALTSGKVQESFQRGHHVTVSQVQRRSTSVNIAW